MRSAKFCDEGFRQNRLKLQQDAFRKERQGARQALRFDVNVLVKAGGNRPAFELSIVRSSEGVIFYRLKKLHLCASITDAEYTTTTEVYPDSPKVTDAICVDAQIAAITGGLDYLGAY